MNKKLIHVVMILIIALLLMNIIEASVAIKKEMKFENKVGISNGAIYRDNRTHNKTNIEKALTGIDINKAIEKNYVELLRRSIKECKKAVNILVVLSFVTLLLILLSLKINSNRKKVKSKLDYVLSNCKKIDVLSININDKTVLSETNFRFIKEEKILTLEEYLRKINISIKDYMKLYQKGKKKGEYSIEYSLEDSGKIKYYREYANIINKNEVISLVIDITDEVERAKKLESKIKIDKLTGIYNSNYYVRRIAEIISGDRESYGAFAFIDLNNFKEYNDTYGHKIGDAILIKFSEVLKGFINENTIVFRIAGDEFGVYRHGFSNTSEIEAFKENLEKTLHINTEIEGKKFTITASVGIAIYNLHSGSIANTSNYADFAMYESKKKKSNGYTVATIFNKDEHGDALEGYVNSKDNNIYLSCENVKLMDNLAINKYKIPEIILMENAGCVVMRSIPDRKNICIVAGCGNNGGDGLVVARKLARRCKNLRVFIVGDINRGSDSFRMNYNALLGFDIEITHIKDSIDYFERVLSENRYLIIDALFGIGFKGEMRGISRDVIECSNRLASHILSIDIPSGMECNTGEVHSGICMKANKTITFEGKKLAFKNPESEEYTGQVVVESIGLPDDLIKEIRENINEDGKNNNEITALVK